MRLVPAFAVVLAFVPAVPGQTRIPPADFAQPQSAAKAKPFPIQTVDQGTNDPRLKGYVTPAGFKLEIVATDPAVVNPVGMTFAPDGRLFVIEWAPDPYSDGKWFEFKETFRYRDGTTKQVATMKKFVGDPVKEMKFNPKTGQWDTASVIIVDELPSTLLYHDGWLYTASRGTVRRYRQSKPNGLWDVKETIAQGFCGFHHHQVSGLSLGNDGKLYITSGDDDNFAEGSDGSRATVLRTGAVFRCNLDGSQLETFSLGYRNPYRDLAHDTAFNWFHADNDNEDGSKFTGCRLMHVAEGVDFGWRLLPGARCCRPDMLRGAVAGELPGKVPPMLKTGRGSPAGVLIYNDNRLPAHYRNLQFYPDVFRKLIRAYQVRPKGSSFEISGEFELLASEDPLFRPCQMVTGPDGAIYICDWRTDSGGAGKLWGDGKNGRLYRLSWSGTADHPAIPLRGMDSWSKVTTGTTEELVERLDAANFTDRLMVRDELVRRGPTSRDAVLVRFDSFGPNGRMAALGVIQQFWNPAVESHCRRLMTDPNDDVRRLAVQALGQFGQRESAVLAAGVTFALADPHPAVRRAAALALGRLGGGNAAELLLEAWNRSDHTDAYLADAYARGLERLGANGIAVVAKALTTADPVTRDRLVSLYAGFRDRAAVEALPKLLEEPTLLPGQRAELVRSFANYQFDPPLSPQPLVQFLARRPNEPAAVKIAGAELLAGWDGLTTADGQGFLQSLLTSTEPDVRIAGLKAVEKTASKGLLPAVVLMVTDNRFTSAERVAAVQAVRTVGDEPARAAVRKLVSTATEPTPLRVEALRVLGQVNGPAARAEAEALLASTDAALLSEAVTVLGATKDGAKLLGERFVAKKLPPELWPRVSEALRKFLADPAILKLNMDVLKGGLLVSTSAVDVAKIRETVQTTGNPDRGRELYLKSTKLACVNCHKMEGVGGSVGPDLTRLWDTHSVEKLIETIVQPSKEIKEGYQSYRLSTADGRVFTGLKVSESKTEVVLREATGKDVKVKREDVEELTPSKVSLMPDDAISQLSFEQFVDLIAFLKSRSAQEKLRTGAATTTGATGSR
jgi:quinoprotein glucose dehydrogenase